MNDKFELPDGSYSIVVCIWANQRHNSLIPLFTLINTPFTSNNTIFIYITHTHVFTLFNQKNPSKNKYRRKQLTHFSMTPLRPKLKKNFSKY